MPPALVGLSEVQNILNSALFNGAAVEVTAFDAKFCLQRLISGDITCFHAVPTVYVPWHGHVGTSRHKQWGEVG